jgi:hypothetical protein
MSETRTRSTRQDFAQSGWAAGGSIFAGSMLAVVGTFQFFEGLVAAINGNDFVVKTSNYVFEFNVTTWGWIHMILGVVVALAGVGILTGNIVARGVGIAIAVLSMIANFLWLPYYPIWAIILIGLDTFVIFALCSVNLADER